MVYGLCISSNGKYLASFVDTLIGFWDLRNLEKPLNSIQTTKNIVSLSWCPTRFEKLIKLI